ncbi:MAG TPA: SDR family NAD(P)-dependent oxidoreductase [Caulobacteraceae bacterium]|jgi:NAD(P)-dependent dehydrogenase (short-subunit alcohol dehydrogenase family)|nr:SDR family NAD(P)-dependent oxidoreductase [Caulobacteraceae bacterium]
MKDFAGKIAVITGGGTGMGRELARQLAVEGCSVAMCDVSAANMAETQRLCSQDSPQGVKVSAHLADVSIEDQMNRFASEVASEQQTDKIHLLFNNAGIGGGGSFVSGSRGEWEKTFNVCWGGVYYGCRAFLPMLIRASEGHIVNTSSVNGFWASLGPQTSHTAYSAAKFAVKGFTEALINDLKLHAPQIKCSVVMPGHIGTEIVTNSRAVLSGGDGLDRDTMALARRRMSAMGVEADKLSDEQILAMIADQARRFRDDAPTTAAEAARIILDGVRTDTWRILVGDDAQRMDRLVRADPEHAYEPAFFQRLAEEVGWRLGGG